MAYKRLENQELVDKIDPNLKFIKRFEKASLLNYKVEHKNSLYVLKIAILHHPYKLTWGGKHLYNEKNILKIAKNVEGITHLIKDYGKINKEDLMCRAILKEYFEGNLLYSSKTKINTSLKTQIIKIVLNLHELGITLGDVQKNNIVISPDKSKVKIIDLGCGKFKKSVTKKRFKEVKKRDLKELEATLNFVTQRGYKWEL